MLLRLSHFFFVILVALLSCESNVVFEKRINLQSGNWYYQDTLHFEWEIKDTSRVYKLLMFIEHGTDYAYQNLYLKIHTHFPDDPSQTQVLSVDFADQTGEWFGKCYGSSCDVEFTLKEKVLFSQTGNYLIQLEQYMRKEPIPHIRSIALQLMDVGPRPES